MHKFFKRLLVVLGFCYVLAGPAFALNLKHHQFNWNEVLELSKAQQQQIAILDTEFREKHKALKQTTDTCRDKAKVKELEKELRSEMIAKMQAVLTDEQLTKANSITTEQYRKMQLRYANSLIQQLNMPTEQQEAFIKAAELTHFQYEWPVDVEQRKQGQRLLEQTLEHLLTDEQKEDWQQKNIVASEQWHQSKDFEMMCMRF